MGGGNNENGNDNMLHNDVERTCFLLSGNVVADEGNERKSPGDADDDGEIEGEEEDGDDEGESKNELG